MLEWPAGVNVLYNEFIPLGLKDGQVFSLVLVQMYVDLGFRYEKVENFLA